MEKWEQQEWKTAKLFVGQQKTFKLNNVDMSATIIGENEDFLDDQKQHPASLTFIFDNNIKDSDVDMTCAWDEIGKTNQDYWNSTISDNLNSTSYVNWYAFNGDPTKQLTCHASVLSMLQDQNDDSAQYIKTLYRTVITYDKYTVGHWKANQQNTKLFLPALSSLFSDQGIDDTVNKQDVPIRAVYTTDGAALLKQEDDQYTYYKQKIANGTADFNSLYPALSRTSGMCLCSPAIDMDQTNKYVETFEDFSGACLPREAEVTNYYSFSPCFCF